MLAKRCVLVIAKSTCNCVCIPILLFLYTQIVIPSSLIKRKENVHTNNIYESTDIGYKTTQKKSLNPKNKTKKKSLPTCTSHNLL